MKFSGLILVASLATLSFAKGPQANPIVGKFTAARNAQISRGPASGSDAFVDAKSGQAVREGFAVRTFRRSFAEITFNDKSALRINEQTDLIVQSAQTLRRIRLDRGQVWVKDENGSKTSVQTPVATATARGTEFTVSSDGTVMVKEGEVDLEAGGVVITLGAGEVGGVGPGGSPQKLGGQNPNPGQGGDNNKDNWYEKPQEIAPSGLDLSGVAAAGAVGFGVAGGGRGPRTPGDAVPEPATMIALGIGAAGLIARKLRK